MSHYLSVRYTTVLTVKNYARILRLMGQSKTSTLAILHLVRCTMHIAVSILILPCFTERPNKFAFVAFTNLLDASHAMREMDGKIIAGQPIFVRYARPRQPRYQNMQVRRYT